MAYDFIVVIGSPIESLMLPGGRAVLSAMGYDALSRLRNKACPPQTRNSKSLYAYVQNANACLRKNRRAD